MSAPRVLVTDATRASAVAVIRSLGRRGAHVIAADSDRRSPGFFSRFAAERLVYPKADANPDAVVEALHRAAVERSVDLIVPVTDDVIVPLSEARERFQGICSLAIAETDALAATRDKLATLELARTLGVPTPRTALVTTAAEARHEATTLGWPVVLKPQASRVYGADRATLETMNVTYADGVEMLDERMRRFEGRCPVLLQEYCTGEAHGVELLAERGRPIAAFQHHRLREVPTTGGASSYRESVALDPVLFAYSVRLLEALEWTGLAMIEFKTGPNGPMLMEINGRVWGSLPLAIRSGVDFPAGLLDLYLGGRNGNGHGGPANNGYRVGTRARNLELELLWIGSVLRGRPRHPFLDHPPRRAALRAAFELVSGPGGFDMGDAEDRRPALVELVKIARKLGRKVRDGR
jgi:predicted ATP-grasp superfamily ATP-dependent carboligase